MRTAWAVALGIILAGAAVWWFGRDGVADGPSQAPDRAAQASPRQRPLYRWRDEAGVVQITDTPPSGRPYETVDVDRLEHRNVFDPGVASPSPE